MGNKLNSLSTGGFGTKKGKPKRPPRFGPRLPRYKEALGAILKTAKFLGNLDLSKQEKTLWMFYCQSQRDWGLPHTIKILKEFHAQAIRFATNCPYETPTHTWIARSKTGKFKNFPIFLKPLATCLLSPNVLEVRMTLSLFKCYEAIVLPITEDISSIVSDSKGIENYHLMKEDFLRFLATSDQWRGAFKDTFTRELEKFKDDEIDFHYTTKKGINGPAAGNAGLQSLALSEEKMARISDLSDKFYKEKYLPVILENRRFYKDMSNDISGKPRNLELIKTALGKLAFVSDKGGKTRVVAVGNYWIQNALYPLHRVCFNTLRYVGSDGTFDQITQFENVRSASRTMPVWSYDLTTATDRIPLCLDIDVLRSLDVEIGKLWGEILMEFPFYHRGKVIKYSVGQPMGFYSSWAMLALGHHAMILYCAYKVGINTFNDYAVIGDDVAIWNKQVAEQYVKLMDHLDVPISKSKSFVPKSDIGPCSAEFAKRVSREGVEITGISPDIAIVCWKSYVLFQEFISWLAIHNFSEATTARLSKAFKLMNLTKLQVIDCLSLFHINGILGQPSANVEGCDTNLIPKVILDCTAAKLAERRLSLLTKQCSDEVTSLLKGANPTEEAELDKLNLANSTPNLVFRRILRSSYNRYGRLRKEFISETFDNSYSSSSITEHTSTLNFVGYNPNGLKVRTDIYANVSTGSRYILNQLSTIEYLPPVSLQGLMDGLTSHDKTYVRRGRYIRDLVRHLVKDRGGAFETLPSIDQYVLRMISLRLFIESTDTLRLLSSEKISEKALEM